MPELDIQVVYCCFHSANPIPHWTCMEHISRCLFCLLNLLIIWVWYGSCFCNYLKCILWCGALDHVYIATVWNEHVLFSIRNVFCKLLHTICSPNVWETQHQVWIVSVTCNSSTSYKHIILLCKFKSQLASQITPQLWMVFLCLCWSY